MSARALNERGGALVLYTVAMVAMMGMGALAIDLGMLRKAKAEAQRGADAAALAGASAFLLDQSRAVESTEAVHRARVYADANYMNGVKFDSAGEVQVQVVYDSVKVRVNVRRANVPTWFARVFGKAAFPVGANAAAVADYATGTACVKPIALSDAWGDSGDTDGDHFPDSGETWLYAKPPDTYQPAHTGGDGLGTGYGSAYRDPVGRDWGYRIVLRPSVNNQNEPCPGNLQGNKCFMPGWWGLWGGMNPQGMADAIRSCDSTTRSVNTSYPTEPGWKGPVAAATEDVYDMDPGARWDDNAVDAVTGKMGRVVGSSFGDNWRASPRMWIMGVFSPDSMPDKANDDITFNNFMLFFFEGCLPKNGNGAIDGTCGTQTLTIGRFVGYANGTKTGPQPGTMIRLLRLVE